MKLRDAQAGEILFDILCGGKQEIFQGSAGQRGGLALMVVLVVCLFLAGQATSTVSLHACDSLHEKVHIPHSHRNRLPPRDQVTSRIIFALARDDALPLSRFLRGVNGSSHVPAGAIAATFVVDSVLMLLPLVNSSALAALTGTCTVGLQVLFQAIHFESVFCRLCCARVVKTCAGNAAVPPPPPPPAPAPQISYAIPILLRCTVGRSRWRPGVWNLGCLSLPLSIAAAVWQVHLPVSTAHIRVIV